MPETYRPRLRVLLDPVYVQPANLSSSSTYRRFSMLAKELVDRNHFVYWMIPDRDNYVPSEIENHPNVMVVKTEYIQDQFVVDGLCTVDFLNLFNRVYGKYHVDALCTCRKTMAGLYKSVLQPARFHDVAHDYTDKGYGLPVILIEDYVQTRQSEHVSEAYWSMQCNGYMTADKTIFASAHNQADIVAEMAKYYLFSRIKEFVTTKSKVLPVGISCEQLDQTYDPDRWRQEKGFKVVSIGRIFGHNHLEFLPWFDYLFKSGIKAELTLSIPGSLGGPMRHKLEKIGFDFSGVGKQIKILNNNSREDYIRQLRTYHAFIHPRAYMEHPAGLLEAVYMGLPGVIPVSDYQQTFFKDYPFVAEPKNRESFLGYLLWIMDNQEEARRMVLPFRDEIREKYNSLTNTAVLANEIELQARHYINHFKTSSAVIKFCKELKGKSYTFSDVVAYLQKCGHIGISIGNTKVRQTFTYSRGAVHHSMGLAGYVDTCKQAEETFVRRNVFDKGDV